MNFGKLILASCTLGPFGYAMGWGGAWLFQADTPSLFGIGFGALLVLMAMLQRGGADTTEATKTLKVVPYTNDPTALDAGDGDGPFLVKSKRKD